MRVGQSVLVVIFVLLAGVSILFVVEWSKDLFGDHNNDNGPLSSSISIVGDEYVSLGRLKGREGVVIGTRLSDGTSQFVDILYATSHRWENPTLKTTFHGLHVDARLTSHPTRKVCPQPVAFGFNLSVPVGGPVDDMPGVPLYSDENELKKVKEEEGERSREEGQIHQEEDRSGLSSSTSRDDKDDSDPLFLIHRKYEQVEDCLTLNIWTPPSSSFNATSSDGSDALLPVLVFIHGGGFTVGSGSEPIFDGRRLAGRDTLVVSINYRLGVFGFLPWSQNDSNFGMKDQLVALQWVQTYIKRFGGDPSRVTLMGQSAGAASAVLLSTSPSAVGLFSRLIIESGPVTAKLPTTDDVVNTLTLGVVEACGCGNGNHSLSLLRTCLEAVPSQKLLSCSLPVEQESDFGWKPMLDGILFPSQPVDILRAEQSSQSIETPLSHNITDVIVGSNLDEYTSILYWMVHPSERLEMGITHTRLTYLMSRVFRDAERVEKIFDYYRAHNSSALHACEQQALHSSSSASACYQLLADVITSSEYSCPTYRFVNWTAFHREGLNLHLYRLDAPLSFVDSRFGAAHFTDLTYVFGEPCFVNCGFHRGSFSQTDHITSNTMMSLWSSFIANGSSSISPLWPPLIGDNPSLLQLQQGSKQPSITQIRDIDQECRLLWEVII